MRAVVLLAFACACNQVWGLDPTEGRPVAEQIDTDRDGFVDASDNCPEDFNDTQADEDGDGHGNACDNCPLVANADQQDIGDGDGVGDRCDPHPVDTHDCLIVFDSFDDPDRFSMHWSATGTGSHTAVAGSVEISGGVRSISVLGADGSLLADRFEMQATARFDSSNGATLWLGTNSLSTTVQGEWFGVQDDSLTYQYAEGNLRTAYAQPGSFQPPLTDELYMRLDVTSSAGANDLYYLVDWGVLFVTARASGAQGYIGAPTIAVTGGIAVVTGFTAYKNVGTSTTCPPPILR